jgi:hypothetical protein
MPLRVLAPAWGRLPAFVLAALCVLVVPAIAQPQRGKGTAAAPADKASKTDKPTTLADKPAAEKKKIQNFDFNAMNLNGNSRSPQLLYFLERANEELERSFLEKRSFIPHMVRSVDEEAL